MYFIHTIYIEYKNTITILYGDIMYNIQFYCAHTLECQSQANTDKCTAYVQAQFNISNNPNDNYTSVAVGSNASQLSKHWAKQYANGICDDFNTSLGGNGGVLIGGNSGENELDLIYTQMPAILVKPLFATNPLHAEWIKTKSAQLRLARNLAKSIISLFPNGGLIGFRLAGYDEERGNNKSPFNTGQYSDMVLRQTVLLLQANTKLLTMGNFRMAVL